MAHSLILENKLQLTQNVANHFLVSVEKGNCCNSWGVPCGTPATTHHYSSAHLFSDKTHGSNTEMLLFPACVSSWPCNNPAAKYDGLLRCSLLLHKYVRELITGHVNRWKNQKQFYIFSLNRHCTLHTNANYPQLDVKNTDIVLLLLN